MDMVDPNKLDAHRRRGSLVVMPCMNLERFGRISRATPIIAAMLSKNNLRALVFMFFFHSL